MNADILEGKWKQMRGVRSKNGGANSPTTTWIGRKARPTGWSACSKKSMATAAKKAEDEFNRRLKEAKGASCPGRNSMG